MRFAKAALILSIAGIALGACFQPSLSEADLTDSGIRARVERELASHRELDLRAVVLDVHSRIVTISGTVPTYADKHTIERLLNSMPGIEQAVVNLVVPD